MKYLLIAAALLASVPAAAADVPTKAAALNSYAAESCSWCGAYVGVGAAYGWSEIKATALSGAKADPAQFMPGGVAGYRWGKNLTFGIEVNGMYAGHSDTIVPGVTGKLQYLGDIEAQLGLAINKGLLVYVGAGPALANSQINAGALASTANNFGWVARVGFDTKLFSDNWAFGVNYARYQLGDSTFFGVVNTSSHADVVQGRLTYRFTNH